MNLLDLYSKDACPVCGQTPCNCTHLNEEKVRLDPSCWKGKKIGNPKTKVKSGVRVNNCVPAESVAEAAGSIGSKIRAVYQKIADQGDDSIEFMYYDSPIFAQYWDEYEGDLDSIIAEVNPNELQIILDELESAAEDQGVAEAKADPTSTWVVYDGDRVKRFKTHQGAKAYAEQHGGKVASSAHYADKIQGKQGVAEGIGNFAKAIGNLHGWGQVNSNNPDVEIYEFDDREGGFYAEGTVYHNTKTGRVKIEFEDKMGEYGGMNVNDTFNSIGDAMNVLRQITIPIRQNTGKAQNFDRLGGREVAGPNDVYKTDRAGKKGTLTKSRMDTMKMSSPYRKTGPKGVLPEQGVAEGLGLYGPFTVTINTGERPKSRTKTKKFRREDDAILWAQDWLEDAPQYVFATAEVTDPDGNVVWTTDEQGVAEGLESYPEVLYHGSTQEIKGPLTPRQAHDIGGAPGSNKNAIYATDDPNFAIAYSLAERGSDTGTLGWKKDPHLIFFGGKIRHGQNVYIYILPTRDQQGQPLFTRGAADAEWHSVPGVKAITPIKTEVKPVDQYLHLLRKPTSEELKIFQANQAKDKARKQGVAEGSEQINWIKPNFDFEWHEVEEQSKMKQVPIEVRQYYQKHFPNKEAWLKSVQNGRVVTINPDHNFEIRNAPYDKESLMQVLAPTSHEGPIGPAKQKRVNALFDKGGPIEMPIILKTSNGLWLIGGKTRLGTANYIKGIPAKVWMIGGEQGVAEGTAHDPAKLAQGWAQRYPNIDADIAAAKKAIDPNYEYASGSAYQRGKDAQDHLTRLLAIKKIINDGQPKEQSGLGFGENKEQEADYGDKYQSMVQRVGQRAREQEKTRPVDIQDLARRLRAIEQSKDDK